MAPQRRRVFCEVVLVLCLMMMIMFSAAVAFANVSYDHRALVIDGKRRVLISGSIHYPRSTPEMWPDLMEKSKAGGLDVIETYVFWNLHEPVKGKYDFGGRKDLVRFVKTVAAAGLYVHLRIGPYACAEWNYGGFPVWLHLIPGIEFRTDNEPFKKEMKRFTAKIVDMMKSENLYASQGGPIILSQIENEYGNVASHYGSAATTYINWAASMATSLDTGVPWVMCQQPDAPDPIINTCNSFYCDGFTPNAKNKPAMWTENWTGWYFTFGDPVPHRPVQDIAFAVARFFQRGGTFQNYYMYHGGTNFDRSTGGPFITTTYDYDAPIDEYGIPRQPKWGHLRDLHKAIKLCEGALAATDPTNTSLGPNMEAHMYRSGSACAAFLANTGYFEAMTTFNGTLYKLPAWSVSILPDCHNVVLNTAQINSQTTHGNAKYQDHKHDVTESSIQSDWSFFNEPVGISKRDAFVRAGLLEQISTTADASDYLWYSIRTSVNGEEPYLTDGTRSKLHVESLGHVLHAFVNGKLAGSGFGSYADRRVTLDIPITLVKGKNTIDLLSATVGLQNYGAFFETWGAGVTGPVELQGQNGTMDLSSRDWTYQIGLKGEESGLYDNSKHFPGWNSVSTVPKNQPLIWYKTKFKPPEGNDPIAIDFTGMGKGEAWVNGHSIGRYWPTYRATQNGCVNSCNYVGTYNSDKCNEGCGKPSQTLYHVPRSLIKRGTNSLVLFEEFRGDPMQISFTTRRMGNVCAHVSEEHPPQVESWSMQEKGRPAIHLECPYPNQKISSIHFASFGTPQGSCGAYSHGDCGSSSALSVVQEACIGSKSCSIAVSTKTFGDPCYGIPKSLAIEAVCM